MKKLLNLFLVGILCLGLTACGGSQTDKDKDHLGDNVINKIEVILDNKPASWKHLDEKDYYNVKISVSNPNGLMEISSGFNEKIGNTWIGSSSAMDLVDGDKNNGTYSVLIDLDKTAKKENVVFKIYILDKTGGHEQNISYSDLGIVE